MNRFLAHKRFAEPYRVTVMAPSEILDQYSPKVRVRWDRSSLVGESLLVPESSIWFWSTVIWEETVHGHIVDVITLLMISALDCNSAVKWLSSRNIDQPNKAAASGCLFISALSRGLRCSTHSLNCRNQLDIKRHIRWKKSILTVETKHRLFETKANSRVTLDYIYSHISSTLCAFLYSYITIKMTINILIPRQDKVDYFAANSGQISGRLNLL